MARPTPGSTQCFLLQLPPELLQSIYLHCLKPNMALASSYLGAVFSGELILRATVFQAFWCHDPLKFSKIDKSRPAFKLPRYSSLAQSANFGELLPNERVKMQGLVLSQSWCTFSPLWDCFSTILSALWQDVSQELDLIFAPDVHYRYFDSCSVTPV